jgi:hypothetical protein
MIDTLFYIFIVGAGIIALIDAGRTSQGFKNWGKEPTLFGIYTSLSLFCVGGGIGNLIKICFYSI